MRWPSRPLRYPPETAVAAEVLVSMALRTDELSVVPMALIQKHHEAIIQPVGGHQLIKAKLLKLGRERGVVGAGSD